MAYPTVTFVKGGTTVTLPAPQPGSGFVKTRSQAIGRTAGGTVVVYDKATAWYETTLSFTHLSSAHKAALESFLDTVAGATWTYTNSASTGYTAQFLDARLTFKQRTRDSYDLSVRLGLSAAGE